MHELWSISYLGSNDAAPAPVIDVQPGTYSMTVTEPDFVAITLLFSHTGIVSVVGGSGPTYNWVIDGTPADYSIFFQINSGTLDSGTAGVWQNLGTARAFGIQRNTVGTHTLTATISIRRDSDSVVLDSADITMQAIINAGTGGGGGGYGGGGGENDPGAGGNGEHLP